MPPRTRSDRSARHYHRRSSPSAQPEVSSTVRIPHPDTPVVESTFESTSSSMPSVRARDGAGPSAPPPVVPSPPSSVPPPVFDYGVIETMIAQAFQQGIQQLRPLVPPQAPPPPPQSQQPDIRSLFESLKRSGLSSFDGAPDPLKAESWLEEVERILDLFQISGEVRTTLIVPFLVVDAAKWWKSVEATIRIPGQPIAWEVFREQFLAHYFPPSIRAQKMDEFHSLEQTEGMTVVQYAYQFQRLGEYVPTVWVDKRQRMYYFRRGLRPDIRREILVGQPQTYEAMYNLAIQLDSDRGIKRARNAEEETQSLVPVRTTQASGPFRAPVGGQTLQIGSSPPLSGTRGQGHQSYVLRRRQPSASAPPSQSVTRSQRPQFAPVQESVPLCLHCNLPHIGICYQKDKACFNCGERGHFMRNCPRRNPV